MKILLLNLLTLVTFGAFAQWNLGQSDPVSLADGSAVEFDVEYANDESGNTYYCWTDFRNGIGELFVQKLDKFGNEQWQKNGIKVGSVVNATNYTLNLKSISPLENGGAVVVWHRIINPSSLTVKEITYNIINPNGTIALSEGGTFQNDNVVQNADVTKGTISVAQIDSNLIRIAYNSGKIANDIFTADLNISGQIVRTSTLLSSTKFEGTKTAFDHLNNRIVVISNNGSGNFESSSFDKDLNLITSNDSFFNNPFEGESRFDDFYVQNGKVLIGRTLTGSGGNKAVIAQCLDSDLKNLWQTGGVVLGSGTGYDIHTTLNQDGGGSAAWIEPNSTNSIMSAARWDKNGTLIWEKPVFNSKTGVNYFTPNKFTSDGFNGFYNIWFTPKNGGFDLGIQHIDEEGTQLFGPDGLLLQNFNWYGVYRILPHISGGVIALYSATSNSDINAVNTYNLYTNLIDYNGNYGISQNVEASLSESSYCQGAAVNPSLPSGKFTGKVLTTDGEFIQDLAEGEGFDLFSLPTEIGEGTYLVQFFNDEGLSTRPFEIKIQEVSLPIVSAGETTYCNGQEDGIQLMAACNTGVTLWSTGQVGPSVLVKPEENTTYEVICQVSGCENLPGVEIPVEVTQLAVSATANPVNYSGQDITITATSEATSYQWAGPNGFVSSTQNAVIPNAIVTDSGVYTVTATAADGCSGQASVQLTIEELLAIQSENSEMVVYPNPSQNLISLLTDLEIESAKAINSLGQISYLNTTGNTISVAPLLAGKYILIIKSSDKLYQKPFIKY